MTRTCAPAVRSVRWTIPLRPLGRVRTGAEALGKPGEGQVEREARGWHNERVFGICWGDRREMESLVEEGVGTWADIPGARPPKGSAP